MTNKLTWQECNPETNSFEATSGDEDEYVVYLSRLEEKDNASLQKAVQETVDKAISLFEINVLDESRYFICEWDIKNSILSIVVSDDTKQIDSKYLVKCLITAAKEDVNAEEIKYWISNYLTTHADFMQYSLIALFHTESRDKTQLL